jgi:hypothetical protein
MPLLKKELLESFEVDVVSRYQNFVSLVGQQGARRMFLGEYLALQDANMPQELQDRFAMAGHKLFPNLKLPALDHCESRCVGAAPSYADALNKPVSANLKTK